MTDELNEDETPKPKRTRKPKSEETPTPETDATPEEPIAAQPAEEVDGTVGEPAEQAPEVTGDATEVAVDEMESLRQEIEKLKATLEEERQKSQELAEEVLDTMTRIDSSEQAVDDAEKDLNEAKEVVKGCKEAFEDAVAHFRAVVKEAKQPLPLLGRKSVLAERARGYLVGDRSPDHVIDREEPPINPGIVEIEPPTAKFKPSDEDDSWKRVPISVYGLPAKLHEALESAEIWTVGHLAAWTNSGKLLTDIPKVGEAKAKVIQDADLLFWERWSKGEITPPEAPKPSTPKDVPFTNLEEAQAEHFETNVKPLAESFEPPATEFGPTSDSQSQDDGDEPESL